MSAKEFSRTPRLIPKDDYELSPFTRAEKEFYDQMGTYRKIAYNWQRFALLSMLCLVIAIGGLIFQSMKSTVVPYVIEVDSNTGMARAIGPAKEGNYTPTEATTKYFLKEFILKTRSLPLDPILYRQNWDNANQVMRKNASIKLNQILQNEGTTSQFGKLTIMPTIVSVVPATQDTYQVRWTEEIFEISGGRKVVVPMTGLFTIEFEKLHDENQIWTNPTGMFIKDFSWSKDQK